MIDKQDDPSVFVLSLSVLLLVLVLWDYLHHDKSSFGVVALPLLTAGESVLHPPDVNHLPCCLVVVYR